MLTIAVVTALVAPLPAGPAQEPSCITRATAAQLAERPSPLDSLMFTVGSARVKVCYGAPSARGRKIFGGDVVPYGQLWRTGANEPTMIHTSAPITVAGLAVPAGVVSLYTVPGKDEWEVIVNRSVAQWGAEGRYTDEIKAQEIGRGKARSTMLPAAVERFLIRVEPAGSQATLVLEWEHTRVAIPIAAAR